MARTVIDIDDKALVKAQKELGTKTKVETVNAALRLVGERQQRVKALNDLLDAMPSYEEYLKEKTDRTG